MEFVTDQPSQKKLKNLATGLHHKKMTFECSERDFRVRISKSRVLPPEHGGYSDGRQCGCSVDTSGPATASRLAVRCVAGRPAHASWRLAKLTSNRTRTHTCGSCDHNRDCCCTSAKRQTIFQNNIVIFLSLFFNRHLNLRWGNENK